MYFFCSQVPVIINEIDKSTQRGLNFIFHEISEYNFFITMARTFLLTFLSLNVSFQKKLLVNTNFAKTRLYVNAVMKSYGVSHQQQQFSTCFCYRHYHLKVKIVTYTFQTLLLWKRGFPQVQFLLLFTFKSYALTLIWLKSLSRG